MITKIKLRVRCRLVGIVLIALPMTSMGTVHPSTDLESQRQSFKATQQAFRSNDLDLYTRLKSKLIDYPLYPYLLYEELLRGLEQVPDHEVEAFLTIYSDTPLPYRLRGAWLKSLAKAQRWSKFLTVYDGREDTSSQCQYAYARIKSGQVIDHQDIINRVWRVGKSQPKACDPLFTWLQHNGHLDSKNIWKRIYLAMEQGQVTLARHLSKTLRKSDQAKVEFWIRLHNAPDRKLSTLSSVKNDRLTHRMVLHGIKRLAQKDVDEGRAAWNQLKHRYNFKQASRNEIERYIALLASYRAHPQALEWFDELSTEAITPHVRLWYTRSALRSERWDLLVESIPTLDAKQRKRTMWRYWLARALEQQGEEEEAHAMYLELAERRDYYGFLAADRLEVPYAIYNHAIVVDEVHTNALMDEPGMLRAHELYHLGRYDDARAEWYMANRSFSRQQQKLAARLAHEWGWHEMAARMATKVGAWNDLELRFPVPFRNEVFIAADEHALAPSLVYSVMRRESIFSEDARSSAGALGLMQLMPATAKRTAEQLGLPVPQVPDLLSGDYNIGLGTGYLRELLDGFDEHLVLAVAAYNAGPHRVSDWLPENRALSADAWIDTIPYYETRRYLRAVLAYKTIYRWKLGKPCLRISQLMQPVGKPES